MIADFDVTEQMLRHFIQKVHQNRFAHPRVVVCVPSGVTGVERRAVEEATLSAGARQAYLIEEPMAAAIGAGLPISEPTGNMIVDIGGGTTEVAVISLGGIVVSQSLRVGGDEMDEAIINYVKREYKLLIGQQTAEEIKLEVGSAWGMREEVQAEVRGRDLVSGLPKTIILSSEEVRHALEDPVNQIVDAIKSTLDKTPPELSADIMDRGIVLAGGGALLHGLDERLRHETHMPMHLAESPLTCVAVGSGRSLEEFEVIHRSQRKGRGSRRLQRQPPHAKPVAHRRPAADLAYTKPFGAPQQVSARGGDRFSRPAARLVHAVNSCERGRPSACCRRRALGSLARPRHGLLPRVRRRGPARLPVAPAQRSCGRSRSEPTASRSPFRDAAGWFGGLFDAKSENKKLKEEIEQLRQQVILSQAALRENAQLKALLDYREGARFPKDYRAITARVIARPPTPVRRSRSSSRPGKNDGISKHDAVVTADGLVGEVTKVASQRRPGHAADRRDERRLGDRHHTNAAGHRPARQLGLGVDPRPRDEGPGRQPGRRVRHLGLPFRRPHLALPAGDPDRHRHAASASRTPTSTSTSSSIRSSTSRRSRR